MSFPMLYVIACYGGDRKTAFPLAFSSVSPGARHAAERTPKGLTLTGATRESNTCPRVTLRVGMSRRNGVKTIRRWYPWYEKEMTGMCVPLRPPQLLRQMDVEWTALPVCFDWWLRREPTRLPMSLTVSNGVELTLPAATYRGLLVHLLIIDNTLSSSTVFDVERNLPALTALTDFGFYGSVPGGLCHPEAFATVAVEALYVYDFAYGRKEIATFAWISSCVHLRGIFLRTYPGLRDLAWFAPLPKLASITLRVCKSLQDIGALRALAPTLSHLIIAAANSVTDFTPIGALENLVLLVVHGDGPVSGETLARCTRLEVLEPHVWGQSTGVQLARAVPGLRKLRLMSDLADDDLEALQAHPSLEHVKLSYSRGLTTVRHLSQIPFLKAVTLLHCYDLVSLVGLGACPTLESLTLHRCDRIASVVPLSGAQNLRHLAIRGCDLRSLEGLSLCRALEDVDVRRNYELVDIAALVGLPLLRALDLYRTPIADVTALQRSCPALNMRYVRLGGQPAPQTLGSDSGSDESDDG